MRTAIHPKNIEKDHILIIYSPVPNPAAATTCEVRLGLIWGEERSSKQARQLATYS